MVLMPGPIDFKNPDTALLRELLNRRTTGVDGRDPLDATGNLDLPSVPRPGGFRPDPTIVGPPEFAQDIHNLYRLAPEMRGRTETLSTAPTADAFNWSSNNPSSDWIVKGDQILLGINNPQKGRIWAMHPDIFPPKMGKTHKSTIGHELGHLTRPQHGVVGKDDAEIDMIEMLTDRFLK